MSYHPTVEDLIEAYALSGDGADFKRAANARREAVRALLQAEGERIMTGKIVTATFSDGKDHGAGCGLEDCECPDHESPPLPEGTYITVKLDRDVAVGLWPVTVRRDPTDKENRAARELSEKEKWDLHMRTDGEGRPLKQNLKGEHVNEIGDTRCPNDGEMTNRQCWKCGWVRGTAAQHEPSGQRIVDLGIGVRERRAPHYGGRDEDGM